MDETTGCAGIVFHAILWNVFLILYLKAEEYINTFQYELAQKFCEKALTMDAESLRALETSGVLLLELEEMEKAKAVS